MTNQKSKYELIKFEDGEFSLDVNVSPLEDTVWLTKAQIAVLYNRDRSVISKHIKNIFLEKECTEKSNVQKMHIANSDKPVELYSLDVILSVGYRVKSARGNLFRRWANSILKNYLLKGITINEKRCLAHSDSLLGINQQLDTYNLRLTSVEERLDLLTNTENLLNNKLFYENEIYDAYSYIKQLFLSASTSITIIDGYIDIFVLDMLNDIHVPITIYTYPNANITNQDISTFSINHNLNVFKTSLIHDRFIIIYSIIYSLGASIKDAGKKRFVMTKLETVSVNDLLKNIN